METLERPKPKLALVFCKKFLFISDSTMVSQLNLGTQWTFLSRSSAVMRVGLHQSSLRHQVFSKHFIGGWYLLRLVRINISASETTKFDTKWSGKGWLTPSKSVLYPHMRQLLRCPALELFKIIVFIGEKSFLNGNVKGCFPIGFPQLVELLLTAWLINKSIIPWAFLPIEPFPGHSSEFL